MQVSSFAMCQQLSLFLFSYPLHYTSIVVSVAAADAAGIMYMHGSRPVVVVVPIPMFVVVLGTAILPCN